MSASNRKNGAGSHRVLLIGMAYLGFIALGLSTGMLGVAWPSLRGSFGVGLDAFGVLLTAATVGYVVASFNSGWLIARAGLGPMLVASSLVMGFGLVGYATAPTWGGAVLGAAVLGLGGAAIDSGMNTYVAVNADARIMNWLHASFGVGAMLGPALMTLVLNAGHSWRTGYALAAAVQGLMTVGFVLTRRYWQEPRPGPDVDFGASLKYVGSAGTLRLPALWLSVLLAFVYTGVEITPGQWSFSLLTEARSMPAGVAGLWVSLFWGSFTVGRLVMGLAVDRIGVTRLVRLCMVGMVGGSVLLGMRAFGSLSLVGLLLVGMAVAPLYPILMATTPARFGVAHAANAIGFQISASSLGGAALPGLVGLLAQSQGLEIVGPFLIATSIVLSALCEKVICRQPNRSPGQPG